jgi:hypothetical protein
MSLPNDWPTMKQAAPNNLPADQRAVRLLEESSSGLIHHDGSGDPKRILQQDEGPLRPHAGPLLADAAIARAAVGIETYGSALTRNNGRNQAVDALQELADAVCYLAAWWDELPEGEAKRCVEHAICRLRYAAQFIETAEKEQANAD